MIDNAINDDTINNDNSLNETDTNFVNNIDSRLKCWSHQITWRMQLRANEQHVEKSWFAEDVANVKERGC